MLNYLHNLYSSKETLFMNEENEAQRAWLESHISLDRILESPNTHSAHRVAHTENQLGEKTRENFRLSLHPLSIQS